MRREELQRLFVSHARRLFALALRLSRNREEAEEVLQETFIVAARARRRDPSQTEEHWLNGVLVNVFRNRNRGRRRLAARIRYVEHPEVYERALTAAMPGLRLDVERAIGMLPERARTVLLLRMVGHSYADIAERLGVALGTVKAHLHQARVAVREELDHE